MLARRVLTTAFLCLCAAPTTALAQQAERTRPDPPPEAWESFRDVLRGHEWADQINNLIDIAAALPAGQYAFRPRPEMRTFGEVVEHIADVQYYFCDRVAGRTDVERDAPDTSDKRATVAFLMNAITVCDDVFDSVTDEKLLANHGAYADNLTTMMGHTRRETGKLVTYLRLAGAEPPEIQFYQGRKWRERGG